MKRILLITDNEELLNRFRHLLIEKKLITNSNFGFSFHFSFNNKAMLEKYKDQDWISPIKVKANTDNLIEQFDMIFSLHCKQLFPSKLVESVKCINVHPGLNPHNRGWFPQVFSILNGKPAGATIHEIDALLDHGPIIAQKEIKIELYDTSLSAYNKILDAEIELLDLHLENILNLKYTTFKAEEGNLNLKADFDALCELNLNDVDTFQNHLNKLRALTHGNYANAFFLDKENKKVYVNINFQVKEN